jgi:hypothetical protein
MKMIDEKKLKERLAALIMDQLPGKDVSSGAVLSFISQQAYAARLYVLIDMGTFQSEKLLKKHDE